MNSAWTWSSSMEVIAAWVVPPLDVTRSRSTCGRIVRSAAPARRRRRRCRPPVGAPARATGPSRRRPASSLREKEDIGRARAGQGRHRVEVRLLHPPTATRRSWQCTCSTRALSCCDNAGRAYRAVMPLPTSAGVLGMDRTMRSRPQPARNAVRADAGGHAQVQGLARVRARLGRGFLEGLRLDRPHHQSGARQSRAGLLLRRQAELGLSLSRASREGSTTSIWAAGSPGGSARR